MNNKYKTLLDTIPDNDGSEDPWYWVFDNYETLKSALTLATESEQLRKERDELAVRVATLEAAIEARGYDVP